MIEKNKEKHKKKHETCFIQQKTLKSSSHVLLLDEEERNKFFITKEHLND